MKERERERIKEEVREPLLSYVSLVRRFTACRIVQPPSFRPMGLFIRQEAQNEKG